MSDIRTRELIFHPTSQNSQHKTQHRSKQETFSCNRDKKLIAIMQV